MRAVFTVLSPRPYVLFLVLLALTSQMCSINGSAQVDSVQKGRGL